VSPSGESWICGVFEGNVDFNPGTDVDNHASLGLYDDFVIHLDANGNYVWGKSWGNPDTTNHDDDCASVAIDSVGKCFTTGTFMDTVDFDPGPETAEIVSYGDRDAFLLKLDYSGNYLWSGAVGGDAAEHGKAVALDSLGNIYWVGEFTGSANLNPVPPGSAGHTSNGFTDVFVEKLSPALELLWADTFGGPGYDDTGIPASPYYAYGNICWVDPYGKAYVGGGFQDTVNFNPSGGTDEHTAADNYDAFITTIPPNGSW
jgi:hypothetical protein